MTRRAALSVLAATWLAFAGPGLVSAAPPGAGTALDEIFPDGLPFPFERVLDRLRAEAGPDAVQTALIPLGRSLQRHSAAPDYFGSPRIVVAVTGDGSQGPGAPRIADRLYLGYVPAAAVVEAIGYDEAAGRFEFQEIVGYGLDAPPDGAWQAEAADRAICLRCHQGGGPIFARPLWSETNANAAVAARLAGLGPAFHGVPVRQAIDALDAFDASTDRAARIAVANRLWAEGCPDAPCRAELFVAALRFGLNGARPDWTAGEDAHTAALDRQVERLWPDGIAVVSPDLPNRDPAAMLAAADPGPLLETTGAMNPETPRAPEVLWRPDADGFDAAAREIAAMLSPGDFAWLDALLRSRPADGRSLSLGCTVRTAEAGGVEETRFDCRDATGAVKGFLRADGGGRIDRLTIAGADAPSRVNVRSDDVGGAYRMDAGGPAPRLPDGERVGPLTLSGTGMRVEVVDDFAPLAAALRASAREDEPALGPGPFRRRALLALVAEVAGGENG